MKLTSAPVSYFARTGTKRGLGSCVMAMMPNVRLRSLPKWARLEILRDTTSSANVTTSDSVVEFIVTVVCIAIMEAPSLPS